MVIRLPEDQRSRVRLYELLGTFRITVSVKQACANFFVKQPPETWHIIKQAALLKNFKVIFL
uniref:Uncharacterized protein n=1 Tax=Octopus bimaculoides TaxID=37653 RepID=A0A0L8GFX8_OCTBM